jgi:hypothetical protein
MFEQHFQVVGQNDVVDTRTTYNPSIHNTADNAQIAVQNLAQIASRNLRVVKMNVPSTGIDFAASVGLTRQMLSITKQFTAADIAAGGLTSVIWLYTTNWVTTLAARISFQQQYQG